MGNERCNVLKPHLRNFHSFIKTRTTPNKASLYIVKIGIEAMRAAMCGLYGLAVKTFAQVHSGCRGKGQYYIGVGPSGTQLFVRYYAE